MPADNKAKVSKPPQISRFDRGPRDFFRGSRGPAMIKKVFWLPPGQQVRLWYD